MQAASLTDLRWRIEYEAKWFATENKDEGVDTFLEDCEPEFSGQ